MTKRKPKEASNAAFDGMTSGHPNLLSGSRLACDRADLNNSHATQNGVTQGPLFRREGARPGVPEAPCPKKGTRKSGVNGLTVARTPKLTRRSGGPGKKVDGSDRQKRPAQVPKAKKPKGYNEDGSERKKGLKGLNADGSARWKGLKGFNKDGRARKTGTGGRAKGAEGVRTKAARLQERLREEGAQDGSSAALADDGGDERGASLCFLA